eukprot:gene18827-25373_t
MTTPVIATAGAAIALYVYLMGKPEENNANATLDPSMVAPSVQLDACRNVDGPPNTWSEALYYFKEVFRYMYTETHGQPISCDLSMDDSLVLLAELKEIRRYLLYCRGLKYKKPLQQLKFWEEHLLIDSASSVLVHQHSAGLLRPAYALIADESAESIVLCIRGTTSLKDLFTSLAATTKPHHRVEAHGVVMGYGHLGMLAAARWLLKQVSAPLKEALVRYPDYKLRHSMGGGTAVLLTTMLRESMAECSDAKCYALACPACMTLELANSCKDYVTSVINGTDIVPTFSAATVDELRTDVMHSSWFVEFKRDLRSSVYRAVQGGIQGVGTATSWTTRNILSPAVSIPFQACYARRPLDACGGLGQDKRKPSHHQQHTDSLDVGAQSGDTDLFFLEGGGMDSDRHSPRRPIMDGVVATSSTRGGQAPPDSPPLDGGPGQLGGPGGGAGPSQGQGSGTKGGRESHHVNKRKVAHSRTRSMTFPGDNPELGESVLEEAVMAEVLESCLFAAAAEQAALANPHAHMLPHQGMGGGGGGFQIASDRGDGEVGVGVDPVRRAMQLLEDERSGVGGSSPPGGGTGVKPESSGGGSGGNGAKPGSYVEGSAPVASASSVREKLWPWWTGMGMGNSEEGLASLARAPSAETGGSFFWPATEQVPLSDPDGHSGPPGPLGAHSVASAAGSSNTEQRSCLKGGSSSSELRQLGEVGGGRPTVHFGPGSHRAHEGGVRDQTLGASGARGDGGGGGEGLSSSVLGSSPGVTHFGPSKGAQGPGPSWLWRGFFKGCVAPRPQGHMTARSGLEAGVGLASAEYEDEDEIHINNQTGVVGTGTGPLDPGASSRLQLQAGITAVVSAVTHENEEDDEAGMCELRAAESVLHEVEGEGGNPDASLAGARASVDDEGGEGESPRQAQPTRTWASFISGSFRVSGGRPARGEENPLAGKQVTRHLYPAGRVLHFFPQSLMDDEDEAFNRYAWDGSGTADGGGGGGDGVGAFSTGHVGGSGEGGEGASTSAAGAGAATGISGGRGRSGEMSSHSAAAKHVPVSPGVPANMAETGSARHALASGPYVLYEVGPNEAYARIKLCRSMVMDHLTPAYLVALDSVMAQVKADLVAPPLPKARGAGSS